MSVDINVELSDILPEEEVVLAKRRVCALKINGKSLVYSDLQEVRKQNPADYKKLLNVIKLVANNQEVHGKHVKSGKGKGSGIWEMRAGKCRLFFFIDEGTQDIVVCTNTYWKAKPSKQEQDQAFHRARRLKQLYQDNQVQQ